MKTLISYYEAKKLIKENISCLKAVKVKLNESFGLVLAKDYRSKVDIPSFDNSAMDGYAVRCEDIIDVPCKLEVLGKLGAGEVYQKKLKKGYAVRIMTGAFIPPCANAVVMQENTTVRGKYVFILKKPNIGENIRKIGEDIKKGTIVLKKRDLIRSAEIGILASIGISEVYVYKRPVVGLVSTGNEIVPIDKKPKMGEIRNSNLPVLFSLTKDVGAIPIDFGIIKDELLLLKNKLSEFIDKVDLLITTGGVSVGDYDLLKQVVDSLGRVIFWKVNIKPGKPVLFGKINKKPIFCLPGNPVSVMITFNQFVSDAISLLMGKSIEKKRYVKAEILESVYEKGNRLCFIRGILKERGQQFYVTPLSKQGSAILSSMHVANCLIIVPEGKKEIKKGDIVDVQLI